MYLPVLMDADDIAKYCDRSWSSHRPGSKYFKAKYNGKSVFLHRLIAGAKPGEVVDHINGNPLDCTKANLRLCTKAENNKNRARRRDSKSPFKGITQTPSGKWLAQIMSDKKFYRIGLFGTSEEAAVAYAIKAAQLHGQFAHINERNIAG